MIQKLQREDAVDIMMGWAFEMQEEGDIELMEAILDVATALAPDIMYDRAEKAKAEPTPPLLKLVENE